MTTLIKASGHPVKAKNEQPIYVHSWRLFNVLHACIINAAGLLPGLSG